MVRFGGSEFTSICIPLVFEGRYFILEPGDPPRVSVVVEVDGHPVFEVLKNEPVDNPLSEVSRTAAGVITVSDKDTGKFLYKVRPRYETSVVFGRIDGEETSARINDRVIEVGGVTVDNCRFDGVVAGVQVRKDGNVRIGARVPPLLRSWFHESQSTAS